MNDETLLGLIAPRGDEELVGAVLTTFVLDGRFFEEELLTTLASLAVGSGELGRASSELHERLLATEEGVTVFVDSRGFDGTRRVGVYDLQQVPAPPTFHPKVALMVWQSPKRKPSVRALVSSANLTREGYRRNAELAVIADSGDRADQRLLSEIVDYLRRIAEGCPTAIGLLDRAARELRPGTDGSRRLLVSRGRPLIDLFFDQLDPDELVESAVVVSPFFERSTDPASASTIEAWCESLLAHSRDGEVRARFFVPERFVDGQLILELPISRAVGLLGTQAELWTLDNLWQIEGRAEPAPRPLHGKLLAVETDRRCLALAGSANFTNAALLVGGAAANWEASVLLSLQRGALERLLPAAATRRDPSAVVFQPPAAEPPLPDLLFDSATYEAARRRLRVRPRRGAPTGHAWELRVDGDVVADGAAGAPPLVNCTLPRHPVNFAVEQRTAAGSRHIPIQVSDKENLPLPAAGVQPRGEDVLDYFAGLRTPAEFDATSRGEGTAAADHDELPALEHLSRFSRALYGIQDSLDRPARSILEYRARWTGAWGLRRIVELLEHRIDASGDDPAYALFEVCELQTTLAGLALADDERCPAAVKRELREAASSELRRLRRKLERVVGDAQSVSVLLQAYGEPVR
jgi:hypothetical protein